MMGAASFSPGEASLVLFGVFFALLALRVPVAFALGLACLPMLVVEERLSPMTLVQETFNAYNSFILLAVPFFLLTANLMNVGGITDRLVLLSRTMVGHFPGSLAQMNVVLSIFFAGISGSSTADAASQGKIFIEAQVKEGYDRSFSIAITAVSAVLAVIIPPSILMIVWGGVLTVSIGALFLAGVIPGLLIGLVQMATVHVYAKLRNYPTYPRSTLREFFSAAVVSVPALMTPFIIIGGKIFGWFTATESACIAVLYAGALSLFVYREMDLKGLHQALLDTGKFAGIALFCVGTASAFGWMLAYYQIPKVLLAGVQGWGMGIIATGFFIAAAFLVVGCFLDAIPAIIIVGTILEPLAKSVHMDPVHFAMIGIVSLAFGLVTPPYGLCLMISCAIGQMRLVDVMKDVMIMLDPDARRARADHRLAGRRALAAAADLARVPEVISGATRLFVILGDPIAKVRSPEAFNAAFERHGIDAVLVPFECAPADLATAVAGLKRMRNLDGLIFTMPHKAGALALVDEATETGPARRRDQRRAPRRRAAGGRATCSTARASSADWRGTARKRAAGARRSSAPAARAARSPSRWRRRASPRSRSTTSIPRRRSRSRPTCSARIPRWRRARARRGPASSTCSSTPRRPA